METNHHSTEPTQYPDFWNEEWLKQAIDKLDIRKMTPEQRLQFARYTASKAEADNSQKALVIATKTAAIKLGFQHGLPVDLVATINGVDEELVQKIQREETDEAV